jgi:hypothetical protein
LHAAYSVLDGNVPVVGDVIALTIDDDEHCYGLLPHLCPP